MPCTPLGLAELFDTGAGALYPKLILLADCVGAERLLFWMPPLPFIDKPTLPKFPGNVSVDKLAILFYAIMSAMFRHYSIIFIILFCLVVGAMLYVNSKPQQAVTPPTSHLDPYKIYNLINDYRASKGLNKLVLDPSLCPFTDKRLSQMHSDYSHKGYKNIPFKYVTAGENIATGYDNDKELVAAWIDSPEHLAIIIKPDYTSTCVRTDSKFAVQEFASF